MLLFWIKRTTRLLLGLVVVSMITHFIIEQIATDPVLKILEDSESQIVDVDLREKEYQRLSHILGTDRPSFYWSLRTMADDQTIPRNINVQAIQILYQQSPRLSSVLEFLEHLPPEIKNNWYTIRSEADITRALYQSPPDVKEEYNQLTSESKWRHFVPVLTWNGFHNRYHSWITAILSGDFGVSSIDGRSVTSRIQQAINWSVGISFIAFLSIFTIAIILGTLLSRKKMAFYRPISKSILLLFYALPIFWLAVILIQYTTGIPHTGGLDLFLPVGRMNSCDGILSCVIENRFKLILPFICLILPQLAFTTQQVQQSFIQEQGKRAYHFFTGLGIPEKKQFYKYISRNALLPIITTMGVALPRILTGSIIIEIIFNIPGLGQLFFNSLVRSDWLLVKTIVLLSVSISILGFLLSDFLYLLLLPKLRQS